MLLQLPKDVLSYILSIVAYETFLKEYGASRTNLADNVVELTDKIIQFNRLCCFPMSKFMQSLSWAHPIIRKILISACEFGVSPFSGEPRWRFRDHFFGTLCERDY